MTITSLDASWPFQGLWQGAYHCILADPPWRFELYSGKGEGKSPQAHYACMSTEELTALPVASLAHPDGCALTMWATAPMLRDAFRLLEAWGFEHKSTGSWAKQSSTGRTWAFGTGYCYRSAAEFWLLGTRGDIKPRVRNVRNLIVAPVRENSRKPDRMHEDIERLWPGPRVELFARQTRPGWDAWGNETTKFNEGENDARKG